MTLLKRIDLSDVMAVVGLSFLGTGLALVSLPVALVVVGVLIFGLAIPPRHFLR